MDHLSLLIFDPDFQAVMVRNAGNITCSQRWERTPRRGDAWLTTRAWVTKKDSVERGS